MIGVVSGQRRIVEHEMKAGLAARQQLADALVRLSRSRKAGDRAACPELPAVATRVCAARERILAWESEPLKVGVAVPVNRRVQRLKRHAAPRPRLVSAVPIPPIPPGRPGRAKLICEG